MIHPQDMVNVVEQSTAMAAPRIKRDLRLVAGPWPALAERGMDHPSIGAAEASAIPASAMRWQAAAQRAVSR